MEKTTKGILIGSGIAAASMAAMLLVPAGFGGTVFAQEDAEVQNDLVQALIDKGYQANMIRFETGTVLNGEGGMEHMASFNYAYKISALRDWLFEQSRHS